MPMSSGRREKASGTGLPTRSLSAAPAGAAVRRPSSSETKRGKPGARLGQRISPSVRVHGFEKGFRVKPAHVRFLREGLI